MGTAFFSRFFALELPWKRDKTRGMPRTFAAAEVNGMSADKWEAMERPAGMVFGYRKGMRRFGGKKGRPSPRDAGTAFGMVNGKGCSFTGWDS